MAKAMNNTCSPDHISAAKRPCLRSPLPTVSGPLSLVRSHDHSVLLHRIVARKLAAALSRVQLSLAGSPILQRSTVPLSHRLSLRRLGRSFGRVFDAGLITHLQIVQSDECGRPKPPADADHNLRLWQWLLPSIRWLDLRYLDADQARAILSTIVRYPSLRHLELNLQLHPDDPFEAEEVLRKKPLARYDFPGLRTLYMRHLSDYVESFGVSLLVALPEPGKLRNLAFNGDIPIGFIGKLHQLRCLIVAISGQEFVKEAALHCPSLRRLDQGLIGCFSPETDDQSVRFNTLRAVRIQERLVDNAQRPDYAALFGSQVQALTIDKTMDTFASVDFPALWPRFRHVFPHLRTLDVHFCCSPYTKPVARALRNLSDVIDELEQLEALAVTLKASGLREPQLRLRRVPLRTLALRVQPDLGSKLTQAPGYRLSLLISGATQATLRTVKLMPPQPRSDVIDEPYYQVSSRGDDDDDGDRLAPDALVTFGEKRAPIERCDAVRSGRLRLIRLSH